jgi:hypothetical protein
MEQSELNSRLIGMGWLLNDLVMDLRTPSDVMLKLKGLHNTTDSEMSVARMCISSMVVGLCKFDEIVQYYGREINNFPAPLKQKIYSIKQDIESKKMYAYRSQYLAHAFSKENNQTKPLDFSDAVNHLKQIIGEHLQPPMENGYAFCKWVFDKDDKNSVAEVVCEVVQHIDSLVGKLGKRS